MKKIMYFVQLPPPVHGAAMCNKNIVESNLINSEFETKVNRISFNKTLADMQKQGIKKIFMLLPIIWNLLKDLFVFKPDIVYFSLSPLGSSFKRDVLFVIIFKLFRRKIVYHLHGKGIAEVNSKFTKNLYRFVFRNSTVICLTPTLSKDIEQVKENANIKVCTNGIDFRHDISVCDKRNDKIIVTFFSNLLPLKGIYVFLEATSQLIEDGVEVEINIAGPFNSKFTNKNLDDFLVEHKALKNNLICHGMVEGNTKWELLKRTNILIHPTFNDALPLVLLEGMASGCFLISTQQGGIPDILENKCFAHILNNPESGELSDVIKEVIENKLVDENITSAIKEFNNKYTIGAFESRMLGIFQELANESS